MPHDAALYEESMNYLQQTGLQDAVSVALVKVINERAGGFGAGAGQAARERMCELLQPEARKGNAPASAEQVDQRNKAEKKAEAFEQQANRLLAENKKLNEMLQQAQRDVEGLRGENRQLDAQIHKLTEDARRLRSEMGSLRDQNRSAGPAPAAAAPRSQKQPPPPKPSPASSASAADVSFRLKQQMGRLWDRLDEKERTGRVRPQRVLGVKRALEEGCGKSSSQPERDAMTAFAGVLSRMVEEQKPLERAEWTEYEDTRARKPPTTAQKETVLSILTAILDNAEAAQGLLEAVDANEADMTGRSGFASMMGGLCDEVLCKGKGASPTHVERLRLKAFIEALESGCAESDDEGERNAMKAFLRMLRRMNEQKSSYTKDEWKKYEPPSGSFTVDEQETFVQILNTILENEEAAEGVRNLVSQVASSG